MKKYWGYFIKQTRHKTLQDMRTASKAPLQHMFGNHELCKEEWCLAKVAEKEGKQYVSKEGPYLDVVKNKEEYEQIKEVCEKFATDKRLLESLHNGDTQANESLNMTLSYYAPKNVNYSHSSSLKYCVAIKVGVHTTTYK